MTQKGNKKVNLQQTTGCLEQQIYTRSDNVTPPLANFTHTSSDEIGDF